MGKPKLPLGSILLILLPRPLKGHFKGLETLMLTSHNLALFLEMDGFLLTYGVLEKVSDHLPLIPHPLPYLRSLGPSH